jgi:hypothetical protein
VWPTILKCFQTLISQLSDGIIPLNSPGKLQIAIIAVQQIWIIRVLLSVKSVSIDLNSKRNSPNIIVSKMELG